MTKGDKRDVTKALNAVIGARNTNDEIERDEYLGDAEKTLRAIDARTGRKDPSERKRTAKSARKSTRKVARKTARKGGRR